MGLHYQFNTLDWHSMWLWPHRTVAACLNTVSALILMAFIEPLAAWKTGRKNLPPCMGVVFFKVFGQCLLLTHMLCQHWGPKHALSCILLFHYEWMPVACPLLYLTRTVCICLIWNNYMRYHNILPCCRINIYEMKEMIAPITWKTHFIHNFVSNHIMVGSYWLCTSDK